MEKKIFWHEMSRQEIEEAVTAEGVIIQPLGAIEQHGPHLPLNTDIILPLAIAEAAAKQVDSFPVLVAPPIWWGLSPQHMVFPGTITISLQTLSSLIVDICMSIHAHGFMRVIILNGHGGNVGVIRNAAVELADRGLPAAVLCYWNLIDEIKKICNVDGFEGHAGEFETSLQLYLNPQLVRKELITAELGGPKVSPANQGVLNAGYISLDLSRDAPTGVVGDPSAAEEQKGEELYKTVVSSLISYIKAYRNLKW